MIAIQNALPPAEIAVGMALMMFSQTLGASVFLAVANVIFTTSLRAETPRYEPDTDPEAVIAAGASAVRDVVTSAAELAGTL
ncbi:hypothetical protein N8T08_002248 [Aspergillus melleus]|uniref:Uncharacterized protein n=1 Tax=Aspergillus melleus TaxID=138277 RepID=A0ACC3B9A1_9EURO|nr:hypothetical protein N8T08_002248 [Aspergillus melleus]